MKLKLIDLEIHLNNKCNYLALQDRSAFSGGLSVTLQSLTASLDSFGPFKYISYFLF